MIARTKHYNQPDPAADDRVLSASLHDAGERHDYPHPIVSNREDNGWMWGYLKPLQQRWRNSNRSLLDGGVVEKRVVGYPRSCGTQRRSWPARLSSIG